MPSNEHPNMSSDPYDKPIYCDWCDSLCDSDDLYGSRYLHLQDKNFCCLYCCEENDQAIDDSMSDE